MQKLAELWVPRCSSASWGVDSSEDKAPAQGPWQPGLSSQEVSRRLSEGKLRNTEEEEGRRRRVGWAECFKGIQPCLKGKLAKILK